MKVIVVSGKPFSGGDSVAKALAERLGYRLIDAVAIIERAAAYGLPHEELNEALRRPPQARDRFLRKRQRSLIVLQSALAEELDPGRCVCYGNLGELLLGLDSCLRIRIEASPDFRMQAVCDRLKLSRNEAINYIRREDRNRERWVRAVCGRNVPGGADIVLDQERLTVAEACERATRLVQSQSPSIRSTASTLDDFVLSCRMRAALAMASETGQHRVGCGRRGRRRLVVRNGSDTRTIERGPTCGLERASDSRRRFERRDHRTSGGHSG